VNEKLFYFENPKIVIYVCLAMLMVVGGINIYSASFVYAAKEFGSTFHFFGRYMFFAAFSVLCLYLVRGFGYKVFLSRNLLLLFGGFVIFGLIFVYFFGEEINSAKRWINMGVISIQPSEFAKLFTVMLFSRSLGENITKGRSANCFYAPAWPCVVITVIISFLVYIEPDAGTAIIIAFLAFLMLFISGLRWEQTGFIVVVAVAVLVGAILLAPYRLARFQVWLNPWADPTGDGYQTIQSLIAIGSGGFSGMGLGSGTSKFYFLPELHTDFAFAIFCQETGFIGVLGLIAVFTILGYSLWTIMRRCRDNVGTLLVSGVILLVIGQGVLNMAMVCGLIPVSGVPLPFISYGGSNLLVSTISIGLALSVFDAECEEEKRQARRQMFAAESPYSRRSHWQVIDGGRK